MSIKEEFIEINLTSINIDHYEYLGYDISRSKDKRGRMTVAKGSKLLINVLHLPQRSHCKLTKICDVCRKEIPFQTYDNILRKRNAGDGKDYCHNCSLSIKAQTTKRENLPIEKSLQFKYPDIAAKWVFELNHPFTPSCIAAFSNQMVWWKCNVCKSHYQMTVYNKTSPSHGLGCPYCSNYRINKNNCIAATNPDLMEEWDFEKNSEVSPFSISHGNGKLVWWKCRICLHSWRTSPNSRTCPSSESGCPRCKYSKGEKIIDQFLSSNYCVYEGQYKIAGCVNKKYLPFDFAIFNDRRDLVCLIEYHGEQHYKPINFFGGEKKFKETQKKRQNQNRILSKKQYSFDSHPLLGV